MSVPGVPSNKLTLSIDGDEVAPEVSSVKITSEESKSDFVSFQMASQGGGRDYKLEITMVQDPASGTLWDQVWAHSGEEVDVIVRPYGNADASTEEPWFEGTVTISEPETLLGGDADASSSQRFVSECSWSFTEKPTRVTVPES